MNGRCITDIQNYSLSGRVTTDIYRSSVSSTMMWVEGPRLACKMLAAMHSVWWQSWQRLAFKVLAAMHCCGNIGKGWRSNCWQHVT